jgi:hypothetical protein
VAGVDAALEFSPRWPNGMRAGAALRMSAPGADSLRRVSAYEAGVMAAPSHASEYFELRIRRDGAVPFGARMTARLLMLDADDAVADSILPFTVDLSNPARRPVPRGRGEFAQRGGRHIRLERYVANHRLAAIIELHPDGLHRRGHRRQRTRRGAAGAAGAQQEDSNGQRRQRHAHVRSIGRRRR